MWLCYFLRYFISCLMSFVISGSGFAGGYSPADDACAQAHGCYASVASRGRGVPRVRLGPPRRLLQASWIWHVCKNGATCHGSRFEPSYIKLVYFAKVPLRSNIRPITKYLVIMNESIYFWYILLDLLHKDTLVQKRNKWYWSVSKSYIILIIFIFKDYLYTYQRNDRSYKC